MKKRYKVLGAAFVMTATITIPVFAGTWVQDPARPANQGGISNWWYRNDDGSYPSNTWTWLDGNRDGVSECYRFDANGWLYVSTKIDGFDVNDSGAWLVNGTVQTKKSSTENQGGTASETSKKNQWVTDSVGSKYYDSKGNVSIGWKKISGTKYYFDENGYMATGYQEIDGTGYYFLNNGKQSTKTVHDSSDGVYYVIEKGSHAVTDIVEESEWWAYKKDADRDSADLSNVVTTDGTEQKTGTTGSLQKLTDAGIYEDWAMACFELINQERKKKGIAELEYDEEIQEACNIRAREIEESYSHTRPDGTSCFTVLEEVGIRNGSMGENIYASPVTPEAAVKGWMNSKGHKANILNKSFKKSAIGFYYDPDSKWEYYWVELFTN